jgi:hypothetical protein
MLLRKLVVVGLVGFVSFAANIATAEDAVGPGAAVVGAQSVNFSDSGSSFAERFDLDIRPSNGARFSQFAPAEPSEPGQNPDYGYEVSLTASSSRGIDVSFAQRGGVGVNENGEIDRETRGSELRLGSGLRDMPRDMPSREPKWYIFAASEDEALIWRPGSTNAFGGSGGGFALQDRVEIGDLQAGVTYEANGWQASLAYVEREWSFRTGARSYSQEEAFAGFTLTMRH